MFLLCLQIFLIFFFTVQKYFYTHSPISTVDLVVLQKVYYFVNGSKRLQNPADLCCYTEIKECSKPALYSGRGEHRFRSFERVTSQLHQAAQVPALQEQLSIPNLLFVYMALFHMPLSVPSSHLSCHLSNTSLLHEDTHLHYDNLLSFSTVVMFS